MNIHVGTDLVEIERFSRKLTNSPSISKNLFTPSELKNDVLADDVFSSRLKSRIENRDPVHLAGIFAAKEAAIKALNLKPGSWLEMEVSHQKNGKPTLKFSKDVESKFESYDLSISHDGDYVAATFVAQLR